jgi:hypothetical protein
MPKRALAATGGPSLAAEVLLDGLAAGLAAGWAAAWEREPEGAELGDRVPPVAVAVAEGRSLAGSLSCWAALMKSWAVTVVPP